MPFKESVIRVIASCYISISKKDVGKREGGSEILEKRGQCGGSLLQCETEAADDMKEHRRLRNREIYL